MREVKFRAWDKENDYMYYDVGINNHHNYKDRKWTEIFVDSLCDEYCDGWVVLDNDWILTQFTGLHDKNGKEIYEGDIICIKHPFHNRQWEGEVVYQDYMFNGKGFFFSHFEIRNQLFSEGTEYIEVIGNIYETPELLEVKK